jgi:hypothetical protein
MARIEPMSSQIAALMNSTSNGTRQERSMSAAEVTEAALGEPAEGV